MDVEDAIGKNRPEKDIDQLFLEELNEELPGLRAYTFIRCERDSYDDPHRRIIYLKNPRNEDVTVRFSGNGSLAGRKENLRKALVKYGPSILDISD